MGSWLNSTQNRLSVLQDVYNRHERLLGLGFFLAGILWDALTLASIDNPIDNVILISYLAGLTAVIVLDIRLRTDRLSWRWKTDPEVILRSAIQFLLGALFSAFVIFYARSITWSTHLAFWILLVVGAVVNEFLTRRLSSFPAQLAFLLFTTTTLCAYLFPVLSGEMSLAMFRWALVAGLLVSGVVLALGLKWGRVPRTSWRRLGIIESVVLLVLAVTLDAGYRYNWIPPVPLSVQHGGVYNSAERIDDTFQLEWSTRQRGWLSPDYARTLYRNDGEPVYAFTSVFAPTRLEETLIHEWQREDSTGWTTTDRIGYRMNGGREDGYRGVTFKRNVSQGNWRVIIQTEGGKVLSRIPFRIESPPEDEVTWVRRLTR